MFHSHRVNSKKWIQLIEILDKKIFFGEVTCTTLDIIPYLLL